MLLVHVCSLLQGVVSNGWWRRFSLKVDKNVERKPHISVSISADGCCAVFVAHLTLILFWFLNPSNHPRENLNDMLGVGLFSWEKLFCSNSNPKCFDFQASLSQLSKLFHACSFYIWMLGFLQQTIGLESVELFWIFSSDETHLETLLELKPCLLQTWYMLLVMYSANT